MEFAYYLRKIHMLPTHMEQGVKLPLYDKYHRVYSTEHKSLAPLYHNSMYYVWKISSPLFMLFDPFQESSPLFTF